MNLATRLAEAPEAAEPPLPADFLGEILAAGQLHERRQRRRSLGVALALVFAVAVAGFGFALRPHATDLGPASGSEGSASLPRRIEGHTAKDAEIGSDPPGQAIALLAGVLGETKVAYTLLGAQQDTYRLVGRVESLEEREQMELSPDGRSLITAQVGVYTSAFTRIDLATGKHSELRLPRAAIVRLLAWSPDGRWLVYSELPAPGTLTAADKPPLVNTLEINQAQLAYLDLSTGEGRTSPQIRDVQAADYDAGGRLFVLEGDDQLWEVDRQWQRSRRIPVQAKTTGIFGMKVSPDGSRFLMSGNFEFEDQAVVQDETGAYEALTGQGLSRPLGWSSPGTFYLGVQRDGTAGMELREYDLRWNLLREVSRTPAGTVVVGMAPGLLGDVRERPADPDRGAAPLWLPASIAGSVALVILLAWAAWRQRGVPLPRRRSSARS